MWLAILGWWHETVSTRDVEDVLAKPAVEALRAAQTALVFESCGTVAGYYITQDQGVHKPTYARSLMANIDKLKREALAQIADIEKRFAELSFKNGPSWYDTKLREDEITDFNASCLTAIERIVGRQHTYAERANEVVRIAGGGHISHSQIVLSLVGIVRALKRDVENDYLVQISELEHANLFADFVEMGDHLLAKGYKDPAAVLIGSVLESHLRQLTSKNGLPLEDTDPSGKSVPRKANRLNTELSKAGVYNLLAQKQITAWMDLRNKAAHGLYSDYTDQEVALFSQGLKSFMLQNPA
jgi:hypothetical protein